MAIIKPLLQKLWASGGAIVQPSDTKIETGWTAEVPPHQWENWIQNRQDQYLAHINERGIPEWDGNTDYLATGKSYVQGSNGVLYKSVAASGPAATVQDPTTDATNTYWTPEVISVASETEYGSTRVATQAEANAGTSDATSVSPLKMRAGFSISLTPNGWITFPTWLGGVIIQWGVVAGVAGAEATLTFPLAWPVGLKSIVGSVQGTSTAGISAIFNNTTLTTTSIGARANTSSDTSVANNIYWIAVGN